TEAGRSTGWRGRRSPRASGAGRSPWTLSATSASTVVSEQLRTSEVATPPLVIVRRPAALTHEQLPQARMIQRPKDVGGAVDREARQERLLRDHALDDHALVRVVLDLDPAPEL